MFYSQVNNAQIDGTRCKQCSYPAHAIAAPTCGSGGLSCGWNCQAPYVQQGNQCVCPHPWTECNGICGWFHRVCPAALSLALHEYAEALGIGMRLCDAVEARYRETRAHR